MQKSASEYGYLGLIVDMRSWLLAALLTLGIASVAQADDTIPVYRSELYLLNQKIPDIAFTNFQVWESQDRDYRNLRPGEKVAQAPLLVVHVWADYCKPCREEFPMWRDLSEVLKRKYPDRLQLLLLSETPGTEDMRRFLQSYQRTMPQTPYYLDVGESLISRLAKEVPKGALPLPITLLVDERRIIRYAIVGSVLARRVELVAAIERLTRTITP